jgi:hypothetical protein
MRTAVRICAMRSIATGWRAYHPFSQLSPTNIIECRGANIALTTEAPQRSGDAHGGAHLRHAQHRGRLTRLSPLTQL